MKENCMRNKSAVLLHVCCAPCLAAARASLPLAGKQAPIAIVELLFYNPNIHPLIEFRRHEKALRVYLERDPFPAEIVSEYGLRTFLRHLADVGWSLDDRRKRCAECYRLRLERAAETARARNFADISTTLLASHEQDRDVVTDVGKEAAAKFGLAFVEADLRLAGPATGSLRGIYRQQYCGCVFSEEERHRNSGKHRYKGSGFPNCGEIIR